MRKFQGIRVDNGEVVTGACLLELKDGQGNVHIYIPQSGDAILATFTGENIKSMTGTFYCVDNDSVNCFNGSFYSVNNDSVKQIDDEEVKETENYKQYKEAMRKISGKDIIKALSYIRMLEKAVLNTDENKEDILSMRDECLFGLNKLPSEIAVPDKICPVCGRTMIKSEHPQYDFTCVFCNKNFIKNQN